MFREKSIKPMLVAEVNFAFSDKYIYEVKFDGIRAIIYANSKEVVIRSRNNIDMTALFPELQSIKDIVLNDTCIFDGEIVLFFKDKPSFSHLQQRIRVKNKDKIRSFASDMPVVFVVFDIIYQNKSLLNFKLLARKKALLKYKDTNYFWKSKVYDDGKKLFLAVKKMGLEGIVAKEKESYYYPGKRSNVWIKLKNYQTAEFYIGGYIKNRASYSLLLGEKRNNKLYYVGKIKVSRRKEILAKIMKEKSSAREFVNYEGDGVFIKPKYKITVNYLEKTKQNMLRHPFI